ncbi:MAG: CocE/NonD family hydrolase [Bryobacterales bacterium]|nr:CocE/NonD family hydrolase [Bryobacterales bacterium]
MRRITSLSFGLSILLFALPLPAEKEETAEEHAEWIKANYTKYEYMIPMRDGMKLFTSVYAPKDDTQPYPIMLYRTPYSVRPYDINAYKTRIGPSRQFAKDLFIFAYQDVRGRMGSEGEFVNVRPYKEIKNGPADIDETTDTYDTIDWLVKNIPNNNGKVGQWGISYPGFYTAMGAIDAHPALKASSPQAPVADWFIGDDFHHNGAFYLAHAFRFFWRFGMPIVEPTREAPKQFDFKTPDGYEFYLNLGPLTNLNEKYFKNKVPFWNEMMKHPNYDEYWKERDLRRGLKDIKPAVMTVGGWFDAEDLFGPLKVYESIEKNSPGAYNILVMGPWYHGQWANHDGDKMGHVPFNAKTSLFYREKIELPFFRHFLKDAKELDLPEAYVFELGTNQWRRYDSWPPKQVTEKTLYFHADGKLSFEPPSESGSTAFDEYTSDPAKPVPFIPNIAIGMTREHMLDDQRFASSRTDVLVYKTDVLEEDITIAGPITPRLHVSTTGTDSDWVVKLIDVYSSDFPSPKPNPERVQMGGYQQLVRGEAMRGRYRNSFEKPEPFQPGKVTKVEYVMPDAYHTFRRGHRIMVHVQSSWFPLVDRNPQKFVDIYNAKKEDFQKATQRVYRSKQAPSAMRLTVLPPRKP